MADMNNTSAQAEIDRLNEQSKDDDRRVKRYQEGGLMRLVSNHYLDCIMRVANRYMIEGWVMQGGIDRTGDGSAFFATLSYPPYYAERQMKK
jgi:predicted dehydrogenase